MKAQTDCTDCRTPEMAAARAKMLEVPNDAMRARLVEGLAGWESPDEFALAAASGEVQDLDPEHLDAPTVVAGQVVTAVAAWLMGERTAAEDAMSEAYECASIQRAIEAEMYDFELAHVDELENSDDVAIACSGALAAVGFRWSRRAFTRTEATIGSMLRCVAPVGMAEGFAEAITTVLDALAKAGKQPVRVRQAAARLAEESVAMGGDCCNACYEKAVGTWS